MKSFLDFLKYNNAVPFILLVILLGTGAVFAASPELRRSVFAPARNIPVISAPIKTDASQLVAENISDWNLALRIDALTEDAENYYVTYSYRTLEVVSGAWQEVRKTSKMDVVKKMLGKRDFKTYLTEQIGQVIDREVAYLSEVQTDLKTSAVAKKSSKYAALVGKEIGKNAPSESDSVKEENGNNIEQKTVEAVAEIAADNQTPSEALLSKEEIREMIVAAVAEFLAVDTSMPDINQIPPQEITAPVETTLETETPVAETPAEEAPVQETPNEEPITSSQE